ncbi:MAG: hypothetical protein RMM08_07705 [Armatimonadota bacterium]|nr:hypothetical protein [bacterium]MDW8321232.1 hypothetical protein [Armatimonadota bacterium]
MFWRTVAAVIALSVSAVMPLWAQQEPGEPMPPPEPPVEVPEPGPPPPDMPSEPVMPPPPPDLQPPVVQPQRQQPRQSRQTGSDVRQVLNDVAQRFRLQLVIDPLLQGRVNPPTQAKDAASALDAVVRQMQGVTWRKVYLRADMELPASETLVNWVRSIVNLEAQGLIVTDAASNRITSFVRNVTVSPGFEQQLGQMVPAFKTRPVYVVFYQQPTFAQQAGQQRRGQGGMRAEDFLAIEQQRMQMFMQMSPEERQRAIRMGVQMFMNMDPSIRMQMMQEGMRWFMNMSPEERQMLIQQGMQMFQQMMGGPPPGPPPAPGR